MQIEDALRGLGLNNKEAAVYRALLELGQTTAYQVAEKSGLKRPTVYIVLDDLRMKGLVLKIPHAKKQLFTAKPPDELFAEAEERLRQAKHALPELLAMISSASKPKTLYFEGISGISEILAYGTKKFPQEEVVGFYAHTADVPEELLDVFAQWNDKMRALGIHVRGIVPEHASLKEFRETDAAYGREMRVVPYDVYSANVSIDMGNEFVRLLDFKNLQGVVIENADIARTMKQIFEMVWKCRAEKPTGKEEQ
ncbi:MAG: helix-turn-helix domain-containing protein [Candidatus Azambacteria bacterium]|nr:helix-turn-helix domain-containing protein [Candidatus Azambacteria bacterium]